MCIRDSDREPLKLLYDMYKYSNRIILIGDHNCEEIKGYISRCRFFIGARTHATIAAYSTKVPTLVAVSYTHLDVYKRQIENSISYIPKSDELKYEYMSYIAFQYLTLMIVPNYVNEDLPKEVVSKIKELKYLLRYDLNNKVHKFRLIEKYLGFNILNFMVKIYSKIRKG